MTTLLAPTPLVVDIARRLQADGWFVMHIEPDGWCSGQLQAVVDVSWAARQAAQLIHRKVQVSTSRAGENSDIYTVTAELVDR